MKNTIAAACLVFLLILALGCLDDSTPRQDRLSTGEPANNDDEGNPASDATGEEPSPEDGDDALEDRPAAPEIAGGDERTAAPVSCEDGFDAVFHVSDHWGGVETCDGFYYLNFATDGSISGLVVPFNPLWDFLEGSYDVTGWLTAENRVVLVVEIRLSPEESICDTDLLVERVEFGVEGRTLAGETAYYCERIAEENFVDDNIVTGEQLCGVFPS
ncbi:MAG: hypothetical protein P9L99_00230 [Candidatus Lernaella stagnicola]|nr:hypothetical protein [Candidatus Lernaella stagnicola]